MAIDWDGLVIGPTNAAFGDAVQYYTKTANFPVTGVFDEGYLEVAPLGRGGLFDSEGFNLGAPGAITSEMPVLGVQLSQFPSASRPEQNDALQMTSGLQAGNWYVVKEVRPDGHGHAKLLLNLMVGPP